MAGSGLLALLDDITTLLDDVATMTKVAATKTVGVVGDDLAVGAEQVSNIAAAREIPVVMAVAKGSFKNKLILIPSTLAVSGLSIMTGLPLVAPLLALGGAYLCYEAFEKIAHKKDGHDKNCHKKMLEAAAHQNLESFEKDKIKGAVQTDFVLSAEIMILTLGTVAAMPIITQLAVLTAVGTAMTAFVYGIVAGIVKLDDLGLYMSKKEGAAPLMKMSRSIGHSILKAAPYLMKTLSVVGTAAMFLVGGGILLHNIPMLAAATHHLSGMAATGTGFAAGFMAGGICVHGAKYLSKAGNACKHLLLSKNKNARNSRDAGAPQPGTTLPKKNSLKQIMTSSCAPKGADTARKKNLPLPNSPKTP